MSSINPEFYAPYDYTPDIPRARHNLSTKRSHTIQTGALVPVLFHRLYKGDDFKINTMTLLQSLLPLNRPLLDCFELRVETYLCPLTNYYGWMDNNSRNDIKDYVTNASKWQVTLHNDDVSCLMSRVSSDDFYDMSDVEFEQAFISSPGVIGKNSMFQKIGVPAGFCGSSDYGDDYIYEGTLFNTVNIERILCYLDIVRSYHVNTQYESIPFYNGDNVTNLSNPVDIFSYPFSHQDLDDLFTYLRFYSRDVNKNLEICSLVDGLYNEDNISFNLFSKLKTYLLYCTRQQGGFFPVQHRPDLWRNLLSSNYGSVNAKVENNADGTINIHEIQDKNHLQSLYDSLYLSGGRYANILRTVFGMRSHHELKIPQLLSVTRQLIDPSNITAQAGTADSALGQKASNVDKFNQGKYVRVRPDVDSYLVVVASITPLISYSQGFEPDVTHLSFNDDFVPQLQGMSFESIPRGFYSALPNVQRDPTSQQILISWPSLSNEVGKNVKWMHYRTDVSRVYGEFTPIFGEYSDMVLTRRYTQSGSGFDYTGSKIDYEFSFDLGPYVNPLEYNVVFNQNSLYDEPWSLHVSFGINAKRPILKRIKPRM